MSEATQTPPATGTICWNEMGMHDTEGAKKFYSSLFGWTSEEMPMPDGPYTIFKSGETQVAGMFHMKGEQFEGVPSYWLCYIAVDDVDAATVKASSLGATIVVQPSDIPEMGRFSVVLDPAGAPVGLYTAKK